uniref:Uncharacterized protein n=1 Tax=Oryza meridionalis TaxID=40149 RepID=A0A0E0CM65_9ORYZ
MGKVLKHRVCVWRLKRVGEGARGVWLLWRERRGSSRHSPPLTSSPGEQNTAVLPFATPRSIAIDRSRAGISRRSCAMIR